MYNDPSGHFIAAVQMCINSAFNSYLENYHALNVIGMIRGVMNVTVNQLLGGDDLMTAYIKGYMADFGFGAVYYGACAIAAIYEVTALVHTVLAVLSIGGAMYELSLTGVIGVTGPKGTVEVDIKGKANKGSTDIEKPYTTSRPSYGKNQVEQVWENAKDPITGKVYDPSGVEITWDITKPRNGQWDMGHIPEEKYSEMHQLYMDDVISKEDFLKWYRDPANYRPKLPSTNRSHKYE